MWKAHIEQNVIAFSPVFLKMPLRLQAFNHFGGASQHHPELSWSHRQLLKMYSSFKSFILLVVVLPVSEKKRKSFILPTVQSETRSSSSSILNVLKCTSILFPSLIPINPTGPSRWHVREFNLLLLQLCLFYNWAKIIFSHEWNKCFSRLLIKLSKINFFLWNMNRVNISRISKKV